MSIQQGQFVEVRGRPWLVEAVDDTQPDLTTLKLSCIADDAQGEQIEVLWDAEIGTRIIEDDTWSQVGRGAPDSPEVLAAYLRAIRWKSATAADRGLLQAPFRAGIRLDAYQLLPLRKALRLPRVNLLIADDVGLGKTVEAGLVARELLLRRRIDLIVISAPPAMIVQWKDELESKFGLTFDIIDRARVGDLRRQRGFSVNPWTTGSRFIIAHSLLTDEVYVAGLRDILGDFRSRALFILDESHHAAPSGGARYAISSQLTRAVNDLAHRFEHRLFLTATPHNGPLQQLLGAARNARPAALYPRRGSPPAGPRTGNGPAAQIRSASPWRSFPGAKGRAHPDRRPVRGCSRARPLAASRVLRRVAVRDFDSAYDRCGSCSVMSAAVSATAWASCARALRPRS
jgi:hypothetical protein